MKRLLRGPEADPRWARPALLALTALLYLFDLGRNGWANDFYAVAVRAGTKSWKAFLFGSFATEGSQEAAPLELATGGEPVMAIGGFNGTDPAPTLATFKEMVAKHEIQYYIGANSQSFGGGQGSSAIAAWVAAHFKQETVGGTTVYDLTQPVSS